MKVFARYEWDDGLRKFTQKKGNGIQGDKLTEEEKSAFKRMINELENKSGLRSRVSIVTTAIVLGIMLIGIILGFILMRENKQLPSMVILGLYPFLAFVIVGYRITRAKRIRTVQEWTERNEAKMKSTLANYNMDVGLYFMLGSF